MFEKRIFVNYNKVYNYVKTDGHTSFLRRWFDLTGEKNYQKQKIRKWNFLKQYIVMKYALLIERNLIYEKNGEKVENPGNQMDKVYQNKRIQK